MEMYVDTGWGAPGSGIVPATQRSAAWSQSFHRSVNYLAAGQSTLIHHLKYTSTAYLCGLEIVDGS